MMMMRDVLSLSAAGRVADASPSPAPSIMPLASAAQKKKKRRSPATPSAASKKLRSLAVDKVDEPVAVAPLQQLVFKSWPEFYAYLDVYCAQTFQVLRSNTCVPVVARNNLVVERLTARGVAPQDQTHKLIPPDAFDTYSRTLVCTHAGEPRRRHEGKRPNRNVRALGCPARINIVVKRTDGTALSPWGVHVTDQVALHNHVVSEAQFKLYPQQRRVTDPDVLRTVRAMRKYGTPRRGIYEYIKDATRNEAITMRDVTNLLNKMKAEDEKAAAMGIDAQQGQVLGQDQDQVDEDDEEEDDEDDTSPDAA